MVFGDEPLCAFTHTDEHLTRLNLTSLPTKSEEMGLAKILWFFSMQYIPMALWGFPVKLSMPTILSLCHSAKGLFGVAKNPTGRQFKIHKNHWRFKEDSVLSGRSVVTLSCGAVQLGVQSEWRSQEKKDIGYRVKKRCWSSGRSDWKPHQKNLMLYVAWLLTSLRGDFHPHIIYPTVLIKIRPESPLKFCARCLNTQTNKSHFDSLIDWT